ncbi:MAG: VanZ family protein [Flavobacteriales bacterium]|nr:VanZ family protein [Flavobacteriales bacterium]MCB9449242.1 VanZ family protein [Flavobacteriales bacterium]
MFFKHNAFALLWAGVILLLCGIPGDELPDCDLWDLFSFDKATHATIFAIQAASLTVGFKKQYRFFTLRYHAIGYAWLFTLLYGACTELLQWVVFTHRSADWVDMMANGVGATLGVALYLVVYGNLQPGQCHRQD